METSDGIRDIFEHEEVNDAVLVVPMDLKGYVVFPLPILGKGAMLFKNSYEMVCVLLSVVFHAKVIHTEGEGNRTPFVGPKTRCDFALLIPFVIKRLSNSCCARSPDFGRPYIPRLIST